MKFSTAALVLLPLSCSLLSLPLAAQCSKEFTTIAEIQGAEAQSPLLGNTLTTQGVVIGTLYKNSKQPMLLLQSVLPDNKTQTSEAILIADKELAGIYQQGQLLELTGTVRELQQMTALTNISHSVVCAENQPVRQSTVTLPVKQLSDWESLEGHYVVLPQQLVVNDSYGLARFGELLLADKRLFIATEINQPGRAAAAFEQQQLLHEIVIDDQNSKQNVEPVPFPGEGLTADNTVRVGDKVQAVEGYLVQNKAGYRLLVNKKPVFTAANARQTAPKAKSTGTIRVASFNVLNFFTGAGNNPQFPTKRGASNQAELERQQAKMLATLTALDADVIGLLEVENNGEAKDSAIATIVSSLNQQLGSEQYAFVSSKVKPGGDDIKVAMIYRTEVVQPIGTAALKLDAPFDRGSRPPLAQSFRDQASGTEFTVSINHFKSKGSCPKQQMPDSDQGDGQACWNPTRVKAAKALLSWLDTNPTGINSPNRLIIGDLNAYRMEDPVKTLEQAGFVHLAGKGQHWSFVYRGRSGTLDHALASPTLAKQLQQFQHWNINADEPAVLDYNTEFKSKNQQQSLYAPTPFRSSDHDPLLMDFKF
ncbi:ExeM/NucH family extracellular endonuclease [Rheinheimera sp.]|uniref:ExeM/NucH family extracellular endonuclease n=1 Tax=Rheinheimera sp. TaxID=1869214 RepID=UPI0027BB1BAC|nr:ExeM/NucH family extracellular endonuclease [Rheinheimera sp.]